MVTRTDAQGPGKRTRDGLLVTMGAALMFVVLLVLQSLIGSGLLSTKTFTVTTTYTETSTQNVLGSFGEHMLMLESRNVSGLVGQYEGNATISWIGDTALAGNYTGAGDIGRLLESGFVGRANPFNVGNLTQRVTAEAPGVAVDSTFDFVGYTSYCGPISGEVAAQDTFVYSPSSGAWLISHETWTFLRFEQSFPGGFC